ncbi:MAG: AraC family transcriptional regulator [Planctomycetaceae bacterium]
MGNLRIKGVEQLSGDRAIDIGLLETLFDYAPDVAFFVKDGDGRYIAVNQSLVKRHGLSTKSEVLGKKPIDIGDGEFGTMPTRQDEEVLTTGKPLINHLELQWHQPHKPVWCFTTKLPRLDDTGNVIGLIGTSRDVLAPVGPNEIPTDFAVAFREFESSLDASMTPSLLASNCGLTLQRLARLTKRLFGLTPSQLITKTRISAASNMLLETDQSISEVAQQSGFYDHSAFTRAFRSATGLTPTAFRNR